MEETVWIQKGFQPPQTSNDDNTGFKQIELLKVESVVHIHTQIFFRHDPPVSLPHPHILVHWPSLTTGLLDVYTREILIGERSQHNAIDNKQNVTKWSFLATLFRITKKKIFLKNLSKNKAYLRERISKSM